MPTFINEYEIDDMLRRFDPSETPNLAAGAIILSNLRDWTNSNSDGWPYWRLPTNAAQKLMGLLNGADRFDPTDCTEAELRRALAPIKSFLTKRGVDHGEVFPSARAPEPEPHPFTLDGWRNDVANHDTILGYSAWLAEKNAERRRSVNA